MHDGTGNGQGQIDGLLQETHNSSTLAMELRLSCANPSKDIIVKGILFFWFPGTHGEISQFYKYFIIRMMKATAMVSWM